MQDRTAAESWSASSLDAADISIHGVHKEESVADLGLALLRYLPLSRQGREWAPIHRGCRHRAEGENLWARNSRSVSGEVFRPPRPLPQHRRRGVDLRCCPATAGNRITRN